MRVLNVIHTVNPVAGGAAEGLRQMVPAVRAHGHEHEVLTLDGTDDAWVKAFPGPIHAIGPVASTFGYHPALPRWLRQHATGFDALIVHGLWQYIGLASRRAARAAKRPYFVYTHGMLDPWFKRYYPLKHAKKWLYWPWGEYRVLRDARAVLFTADDEPRLASRSFWLYRARESVVGYGLRLGDDARGASAAEFLARCPELRGKRVVLFLGRLHVKKGCDLLVDAFARVAQGHPDLHLVMAGPDSNGLRAQLEARARAAGVAERIVWTGMLTGSMKWSAFRAAEVFVLPSHQENFGVAVVEAMAMGVPVLISRRVNIWREIVEADAGFSAEDDLTGTLSMLQRWLRLGRGERAAMSAAAIDCFESRFHVDQAARRLVQTLDAEVRSA